MPLTLLERFKLFYWSIFEPFFPTVRDIWVFFGFIKHEHRQPFSYGWLKEGIGERDLRQMLTDAGFTSDYIGWIDPEEVLNMRKFVDLIYQYHVRLFHDGEVCGHHEYTPESHPFKHLHDTGMTAGEDYLKPLLSPYLGHLAPHSQGRETPNPTQHQPHSAASPKSDSGANQ